MQLIALGVALLLLRAWLGGRRGSSAYHVLGAAEDDNALLDLSSSSSEDEDGHGDEGDEELLTPDELDMRFAVEPAEWARFCQTFARLPKHSTTRASGLAVKRMLLKSQLPPDDLCAIFLLADQSGCVQLPLCPESRGMFCFPSDGQCWFFGISHRYLPSLSMR